MSGRVWLSSVTNDYRIGNKQGLRDKYYGEDWETGQHEVHPTSPKVLAAMNRHTDGYALERTDFPEASAVWNRKCFDRIGDLFVAGRFYAAKGRLAEVLKGADFGDGGLIPYPIFQEDLETPIEGEFYILNFGARKNTFLSSESKSVEFLGANKELAIEYWAVDAGVEDGDIALSPAALVGPDLWVEEKVRRKFFMSEALVSALIEAKLALDFRLNECRIVGGSP